MEMFLMVLCLSMFGLAVTVAAFGAAVQPVQPPPEAKPVQPPAWKPATAYFFASDMKMPPPLEPQVPIEALLLQIDNHVRLEQAAAESFLQYPTSALLHSKTISKFVN